jgi:glutamine synthetase
MIEMAKRDILPAVTGYSKKLADTIIAKRGVLDSLDCTAELSILQKLSKATGEMYVIISELEGAATDAKAISGIYDRAKYYRDTVIPLMEKLRTVVDSVEPDVEAGDWPYPSYGELLYRV